MEMEIGLSFRFLSYNTRQTRLIWRYNNCQRNQWKYDVFLSFRGEDTRDNFTSHLYAALCRKGVKTFMDNDLKKGEEITPTILQAIEASKVAVAIFSKNYAFSTYCLDELVSIMECKETCNQIVVPVFYHVDPSDVSQQTGRFAEAFARHEKNSKNLEKLQRWRAALAKAANLAGWDAQVTRPESLLIDEITKDISVKLKCTSPSGLEGLVGIHPQIKLINAILFSGSLDVCVLGIWGMGGIGKTSIAEAIFNLTAHAFEGCCFLSNVREQSEKCGLIHLREELFSKILGERNLTVGMSNVGSSLVNTLCNRKVLIVLDDVDNSRQLEILAGDRCWFGWGSRIIITSRDKQVLRNYVDFIYEVEGLIFEDAFLLFSWNAFKQNHPTKDFAAMSRSVVEYAKGNPLALKILGSFLYGKSIRDWKSALDKLKKAVNLDIHNVLKLSYDGLDEEEKTIFLHISCFFKGDDRDTVTQILDGCGLSTDIGICVLIDRSLITISKYNTLEMHDLLQVMGMEIVRRESKEPGKRSRLWNHKDIYQVLSRNTGTEAVEGLFLDMSRIREIQLHPDAFSRMPNLKLLKLYESNNRGGFENHCKVQLSKGLKMLPDEIRYLYWHGYPLSSLPANFHPVELLVLKLPYSRVKRPWKGAKELRNLKQIDLSYCHCLSRTPNLSLATNLVSMVLEGYANLVKVSSSIRYLSNVKYISLKGCQKIRSLPSTVDLKSLETLVLSRCSNLEKFPEVSRNIHHLYLEETAIKEVPSSIECLSGLIELRMENCTKLEILSRSICKLKSLKHLILHGCSNFKTFPEILEIMDGLEVLSLSGTAIEELPFSIENLKGLCSLYMKNCTNLAHLPESFSNLRNLHQFHLSGCSKLEKLPSNLSLEEIRVVGCRGQDSVGLSLPPLSSFPSLSYLSLRDCNISKLPADLDRLSSIVELHLTRSSFEQLPESIKQLSLLAYLGISYCHRLRSLPELPPTLYYIDAHDCRSLESVYGLGKLFESQYHHSCPNEYFIFTQCFKLDQNEWSDITAKALLRIQCYAKRAKDNHEEIGHLPAHSVCHPGSEIPGCFANTSLGASITIQLPPYWHNNGFLGFALCAVVAFQDYRYTFFSVQCSCHYENSFGDRYDYVYWLYSWDLWWPLNLDRCVGSEHVLLWYDPALYTMPDEKCKLFKGCCNIKVSFELHPEVYQADIESCKVKSCGVALLYDRDQRNGGGEAVSNRMNLVEEACTRMNSVQETILAKRKKQDPEKVKKLNQILKRERNQNPASSLLG